jgi:hypothetical protein
MTALWITAVVVALLAGGFFGFLLAAMTMAGRRDDECWRCRSEALASAFRECDSFGGTDG